MDKELMGAFKSILDDALQPIHRELKAIDQRFDRIDQRFDAVDSRFEEIDKRFDAVDSRFEGIDKRFDAVDTRFEGIDKRFDAVDSRFEGIDKRFDAVDTRFERIDGQFVVMDHRIGSLADELKEFRAETKAVLQVIQDGQRGTREEMTQRFNETQEGLNRMESDFKFVNHKTADHDLKFHRIESELREKRQ